MPVVCNRKPARTNRAGLNACYIAANFPPAESLVMANLGENDGNWDKNGTLDDTVRKSFARHRFMGTGQAL